MQSAKISIVTVCYNAVATIEETIKSVINQTYDNIEYIVIDGGSTDGTVDVIKKYASKITYWVSEPDNGIYDAMNKGIAKVTGEYINFMNAGDLFVSKDIIKTIFETQSQSADIIYGDAILAYPDFKLYCRSRSLDLINKFDPIFHQSSFTKVTVIKTYPFDTSYKIAGDYHFFYNRYMAGNSFHYIDIPIAIFDAYGGISSNAVGLRVEEGRRITGRRKDIKFILYKYKLILKNNIRLVIEKYSPKFAAQLRKKILLRNPRIKKI